jgi:hypothetical protein
LRQLGLGLRERRFSEDGLDAGGIAQLSAPDKLLGVLLEQAHLRCPLLGAGTFPQPGEPSL